MFRLPSFIGLPARKNDRVRVAPFVGLPSHVKPYEPRTVTRKQRRDNKGAWWRNEQL